MMQVTTELQQELVTKEDIVFSSKIAEALGLNEAIIWQQVMYWSESPTAHQYDGLGWFRHTLDEWVERLPFFSKNTINRALKKLKDAGAIRGEKLCGPLFGRYSDQTVWYTVDSRKSLAQTAKRVAGGMSTREFRISVAQELGLSKAIVLQQVLHLSGNSDKQHDGRLWDRRTIEQWHEELPFLSESTIKTALRDLRKDGYIEAKRLDGLFLSNPWGGSLWYSTGHRNEGKQ